jgi:two-component system sensor histidine kinase KdpD
MTSPARAPAVWPKYLASLALVAGATGLGALAGGRLAPADPVMLYLLGIGVAAARFGRGPSLIASATSVLAYDFFFVPPYHTFTVANERHLLTFATMFIVGLVTSGLTSRIRKEQQQAIAREQRTAALYSLSRDLGGALDEARVAQVAVENVARMFGGSVTILLPEEANQLVIRAQAGAAAAPLGPAAAEASQRCWRLGQYAGAGTDVVPGAAVVCAPLRAGDQILGALVLAPTAPIAFPSEQADLLDAFARQAALALARARFAQAAEAAALWGRTEQMRSSLLSAVSHDLRTPLAAITGAATTLRDNAIAVGPDARAELLDTICEEAERLERLVRNLLDMTRLDSGAIEVKRDWVPIEEIVGAALTRLETQLAGRPITTSIPIDLPLVSVDPVLLEQVFINLLENAAKYAPATAALDVVAHHDRDGVVVEVADRGPGLPLGNEARIFEKFFRGASAATSGAGLGLAISRGIMEAHGGALTATNRTGGGASFRVTIPPPPGGAPGPTAPQLGAPLESESA